MNKAIDFIEIGCEVNACPLVASRLDVGGRGVFLDVNQNFLSQRQKTLGNRHVYICALVAPKRGWTPFFLSQFAYSSVLRRHTMGHHLASHKLTKETMPQSDILPLGMFAVTLMDVLIAIGEKNLNLLSIDIEGLDCDVLKTTSFDIFRPKTIIFEHHHSEGTWIHSGPKYQETKAHLQNFGYKLDSVDEYNTSMTLSI